MLAVSIVLNIALSIIVAVLTHCYFDLEKRYDESNKSRKELLERWLKLSKNFYPDRWL
jgi:hypothetical protein